MFHNALETEGEEVDWNIFTIYIKKSSEANRFLEAQNTFNGFLQKYRFPFKGPHRLPNERRSPPKQICTAYVQAALKAENFEEAKRAFHCCHPWDRDLGLYNTYLNPSSLFVAPSGSAQVI